MNAGMMEIGGGVRLAVDEKGYLRDPSTWTPEVALTMAAADQLQLTPDHWIVIGIFRDYYARFEVEPPMRALVKEARLRLGVTKGTSLYLYQLFPAGPPTQACRYAGLPRPISCI